MRTWWISSAAVPETPADREVPRRAAAIFAAHERGDRHGAVVAELEFQGAGCAEIGSPLYGDLLGHLAADAAASGIAWDILEPHADEPPLTALGLRLMAAVHRLVLTGRAPGLAPYYPSVGGDLSGDGAWSAFHAVLREHRHELREGTSLPCQTNEPGRSAALLGGFLTVARATGLPLRILEVGASAGLNLRWDHFRYVAGPDAWGPPGSPVTFDGVFESAPPLDVTAVVAERRGCDPRPQDPTSETTRLNLRASAWPDQLERFTALEGALEVAARVPAEVDRVDGPTWVAQQLAEPRPGLATVVYHSIVMQYLSDAGRTSLRESIAAAGERATPDAPVAWLSMEPGGGGHANVNLSTWPAGEERLIAEAGYHGRPVRWLDPPRPPAPRRGTY